MIRLYRRAGVYWVDESLDGRRARRSLHTRDAQTARALLRALELDVLSGGRLKKIAWPEFQEEFLRWIEPQVRPSTLRGYRITAKRFGRFLGARAVCDIGTNTIAAFLEERKTDQHPSSKRPPGPGGIRFDLRCLHRIFSYAIAAGYLSANPVTQRNLNVHTGQTLPFTQDNVTKMLDDPIVQADAQLRAIVLVFLHTGLRISDVIYLRKSDLVGDSIVRRTRKRGRVVSLRLHPDVVTALQAHSAAKTKSDYLFTTKQSLPIVGLDKTLRRLWKRCEIPSAHAHRFRDTFAVRLLEKGASLYDVAKLLGISAQTADRHYTPYVKELQERGADLIARLDFVK